MPTFQPYGGWGWYLSCLFPPSALSLFANVLIKVEAGGQGLHWDKLGISVTSESAFPFSARVVIIALIVDILLYALLAAYLDKVSPLDHQRLCTAHIDLVTSNCIHTFSPSHNFIPILSENGGSSSANPTSRKLQVLCSFAMNMYCYKI